MGNVGPVFAKASDPSVENDDVKINKEDLEILLEDETIEDIQALDDLCADEALMQRTLQAAIDEG